MNQTENIKNFLLVTTDTIPFFSGDGNNAFAFAKALFKEKQNLTLLTLNKNNFLPKISIKNKVSIRRIPYYNNNNVAKAFSRIIILLSYLINTLRNDIILIYGKVAGVKWLILTGWLFRKKVIFRSVLYEYDDIDSIVKKNTRVNKFIYSKINIYFSLHPEFSKSYLSNYNNPDKLFESVQGVDIQHFSPVNEMAKKTIKQKLNLPLNKIIVISAGYLIRRKGFDEIFEIFSKIKIPFLYIIVGNYSIDKRQPTWHKKHEMEDLHTKAKKLLGDRIYFTGPKENIHEYYQASDIFILNSLQEGVPNTLLEAMATGITPLVRDISGLKDYILFHRKNSLVYHNPQELRNYFFELHQNSKLRKDIGARAAKFAKEKLSIDKVADSFIKKISS